MAKTYIFAIGGTGSRVLKSLAFLLSSGVECNTDSIIPIIIDPDDANGDVSRTVDVLKQYQEIRKKLKFSDAHPNQFFKVKVDSLPESTNFKLRVEDSSVRFKEYIDYSNLDRKNKALASILFSENNLNADMEVGFKGNPNIGSVVLNQFQNSQGFQDFASSFVEGDRIFIISSIFGGTGAAGFPLLLKNIRSASEELASWQLLRNAPVGAISVLPYFGVKNDADSEIDRSTFISKTKAALQYYLKGVNKSVNQMYYIADKIMNDYENNEGGTVQKNKAHLMEFLSGLAVIDFINTSSENLEGENKVKEFGIETESSNLTFTNFYSSTKSKLFKPLSSYYYFRYYLKNMLSSNLEMKFAKEIDLKKDFLTSDFYLALDKFNNHYWDWLKELSENERGLSLYTLKDGENVFHSITGIEPKGGGILGMLKGKDNNNRLTAQLNKNAKKHNENIENNFMNLFYKSMSNVIEEKY
ncbi:hypothetical protein NMK71_04990 [Weeksellaceae bacterium KMM 9713]|uniref:Uncharacterized protein n=1 Tax=Profundicola chukchiensis TaxID=2961959 RepID=A0A9X4RWH4_9FLAO|nr:hypothetical protein [Profundicola chukchiensis]MDG4945762.1 hypothetical protein [Profundicola chukchiensis]